MKNEIIKRKLEIAIDKVHNAITLKTDSGQDTNSLYFIIESLYKEIEKL